MGKGEQVKQYTHGSVNGEQYVYYGICKSFFGFCQDIEKNGPDLNGFLIKNENEMNQVR